VLEVDKQIKQLLSQSDIEDCNADSSENKDWELPIPKYVFFKRARFMENFFGPEAENFNEDKLLIRRIQVIKDMVASRSSVNQIGGEIDSIGTKMTMKLRRWKEL